MLFSINKINKIKKINFQISSNLKLIIFFHKNILKIIKIIDKFYLLISDI
jgi:hypothetical protein